MMTSQSITQSIRGHSKCYVVTWKGNSLDIGFIRTNIHGLSCKEYYHTNILSREADANYFGKTNDLDGAVQVIEAKWRIYVTILQIMATCRLLGTKSQSRLMLVYYQFNYSEKMRDIWIKITTFLKENVGENVVCKMPPILSRSQCVTTTLADTDPSLVIDAPCNSTCGYHMKDLLNKCARTVLYWITRRQAKLDDLKSTKWFRRRLQLRIHLRLRI